MRYSIRVGMDEDMAKGVYGRLKSGIGGYVLRRR
jgi:hypothetical protein